MTKTTSKILKSLAKKAPPMPKMPEIPTLAEVPLPPMPQIDESNPAAPFFPDIMQLITPKTRYPFPSKLSHAILQFEICKARLIYALSLTDSIARSARNEKGYKITITAATIKQAHAILTEAIDAYNSAYIDVENRYYWAMREAAENKEEPPEKPEVLKASGESDDEFMKRKLATDRDEL